MVARRQRGIGRVAPATAIVGGNFSQRRAVIVETNGVLASRVPANDGRASSVICPELSLRGNGARPS